MIDSKITKQLFIPIVLCIVVIFTTASFSYINNSNTKVDQALEYCKLNKFNTSYCILVNMSIHSGKNRFVVWDFKNKKPLVNCLVSHGCCDNSWAGEESKDNPRFNNIPESHCSSLGKYKIGKRGWSNWGIHVNYLLHGLESSNNKALRRQIVLHSWNLVSENETYPIGTPEGWGCPAISNKNMKIVDSVLQNQEDPVLMWIYN